MVLISTDKTPTLRPGLSSIDGVLKQDGGLSDNRDNADVGNREFFGKFLFFVFYIPTLY